MISISQEADTDKEYKGERKRPCQTFEMNSRLARGEMLV